MENAKKPKLKQVTMNLTEQDEQTADALIRRINVRSKAQVVSTALAVMDKLTEQTGRIIIRRSDGQEYELLIPGLQSA